LLKVGFNSGEFDWRVGLGKKLIAESGQSGFDAFCWLEMFAFWVELAKILKISGSFFNFCLEISQFLFFSHLLNQRL
jgi:hypothetical protein